MIKDICGFEGLYQITKNNIQKKVHRLVAEAFLPNPEGKTDVNHKDYQRDNNCASNLEWLTHKENVIYQAEQGHLFPNRNLIFNFS